VACGAMTVRLVPECLLWRCQYYSWRTRLQQHRTELSVGITELSGNQTLGASRSDHLVDALRSAASLTGHKQ